MRFAFTIWFRVFFYYIVYIWRRFPPINLRYMSLWTTSRLVLTFTSFMYENQPELIDTYFSHEYCFHFENKGQCLLIVYVFCSLFTKGYTCICIFLQWHQQTTHKLLNVYINCQIRPSKRGCCQSSFQISKRNLASSKFSGVTCQENLYKITTKNLI